MSPERAARMIATLGAVLLLALFALRGVSLAQTLTAPPDLRQEESLEGISLRLYEYSPDGSQVSFQQKAPNQITRFYTLDLQSGAVTDGRLEQTRQKTFYVMDEQIYLLVGEEYVRIEGSPLGIEVHELAVSFNGDVAAFTGQRPGGPDGLYLLYNNGQLKWLGEEEWIISPTWSPDGQTILYIAPRDGFNQIISIRIDGTGQQQLTNDPSHKRRPTWSPDGSAIAFLAAEPGPVEVPPVEGPARPTLTPTATATPTGAELTPTPTPQPSFTPTPRGPSSLEDAPLWSDIFVIRPDGDNLRRLTHSPEQETTLAWINGGSELAYALSEPEQPDVEFLYALNPQMGTVRRAYPALSMDAIECPPSLSRHSQRSLRLAFTNQGLRSVSVPVILRAGTQPFPQQSYYNVDERRTDAARIETVDLPPGETRTVEWSVSPASGVRTFFSAVIDRPESVLFFEQHCMVQNTYYGLPNLPFLPVTLLLLIPGMLLAVPWLRQQKRRLLWILWALIPVVLAGLILYEAQKAALDKIFMPF